MRTADLDLDLVRDLGLGLGLDLARDLGLGLGLALARDLALGLGLELGLDSGSRALAQGPQRSNPVITALAPMHASCG